MGAVVYGVHVNEYGHKGPEPTTQLRSDVEVSRADAAAISLRPSVASVVITAYHVDHEDSGTPARWLVASYADGRDVSTERYTDEERHHHAHAGAPAEPERTPSTPINGHGFRSIRGH